MLDTHNSSTEIFGETIEVEVDYEWDGGYPILYTVKLIKQIAKKGQVFYDAQGKAHHGPAWKRVGINDVMSEAAIRILADEICENATVQRFEDAADRAMDQFIFNRHVDPFNAPEPKHYTETMREACA